MEISFRFFNVICTCSHIDFIMLLFDYIVVDFKIFSQLCYVLKALLAIHIGQMMPLWSLTLWWLSTGFSGSSCGGMIDTYVKQQALLTEDSRPAGPWEIPPTTSTVQYSFAAQVGAVVR